MLLPIAAAVFSITYLNETCSSTGSCWRVFAEAISNTDKSRPITLVLEPGVYEWNMTEGVVSVSNISQGITIAGEGAEIKTFGSKLSSLFHFDFVPGLVIHGLTVDAERQPYSFGQVSAVTNNNFTVAINTSEYPFQDGKWPWVWTSSNLYGAIDVRPGMMVPQNPMYWGGGGDIKMADEIKTGSNSTESVTNFIVMKTHFSPKFIGHWLVLEHGRNHNAFTFEHCNNLTLSRYAKILPMP